MLKGSLQGSAGAEVGEKNSSWSVSRNGCNMGVESGVIIPALLTSLEMMQSKGVFLVWLVCWFVVLLMREWIWKLKLRESERFEFLFWVSEVVIIPTNNTKIKVTLINGLKWIPSKWISFESKVVKWKTYIIVFSCRHT